MAEVKWIKITTDMFDNRKIKHLRKMPDGNNLVLIWVMLLTMAGRCNANGMIFLTESFPYDTKMLADELDFEENTVKLALSVFEMLGMVVFDGDFLVIAGWNEYQNADRLSEIREYNRLAKQKSRARQKQLKDVNDMSMTSQRCQDTDIDIDKDKELDIKRKKFERKPFVIPTVEEVAEYCKERGNRIDPEAFIDYYSSQDWKKANGIKVKDWKACVRTWEKKDKEPAKKNSFNKFDQREYKEDDLEAMLLERG